MTNAYNKKANIGEIQKTGGRAIREAVTDMLFIATLLIEASSWIISKILINHYVRKQIQLQCWYFLF